MTPTSGECTEHKILTFNRKVKNNHSGLITVF